MRKQERSPRAAALEEKARLRRKIQEGTDLATEARSRLRQLDQEFPDNEIVFKRELHEILDPLWDQSWFPPEKYEAFVPMQDALAQALEFLKGHSPDWSVPMLRQIDRLVLMSKTYLAIQRNDRQSVGAYLTEYVEVYWGEETHHGFIILLEQACHRKP